MNTANTILVISVGVFFAGMIVFGLAFSQWLRLYHEDKELRDR
jgi:hypothetical protein